MCTSYRTQLHSPAICLQKLCVYMKCLTCESFTRAKLVIPIYEMQLFISQKQIDMILFCFVLQTNTS